MNSTRKAGAKRRRLEKGGVALLFALGLMGSDARGQQPFATSELLPSPGILRNSVTNLHAEGAALWVGPFLNVTHDGGLTWKVTDADSLAGFRNRVYSLDVEGDVLWVGLGVSRIQQIGDETRSINLARGFLRSLDAGATWTYVSHLPPADTDPATTGILDLPNDTLISYGGKDLPALAITVPELSPPWDIDYDPLTGALWTANEIAGVRKSVDDGRTWRRVVLPPDTSRFLSPDLGYEFPLFSQLNGIPLEDFFGLNFQAHSVLVDGAGAVWAGTPGGLNRSEDGGESWRHYTVADGMPGDWVISIEEQVRPGLTPAIWAATWPGRKQPQYYGAVVTRDGGATFTSVLHNEKVFDFAFDGPRVYIAGERGLFISEDNGHTFRTVRDFYDRTKPEFSFRPGAGAYSVAVGEHGLWVGTDDGLFKSTDGGDTWRVFRANAPLGPDGLPPVVPPESAPRVEAYAYPNPFSPGTDRVVRLRYKLETDAAVVIRVFDFAMNLVRSLRSEHQSGGEREVSWDGVDDRGARVANGAYFYAIQAGSDTYWGKILVLE